MEYDSGSPIGATWKEVTSTHMSKDRPSSSCVRCSPMCASGVMSRASPRFLWKQGVNGMEWKGRLSIFTFHASILLEFCLLKADIYIITNFKKQGLGRQVFTVKSGYRQVVKSCHMAFICSCRKIRSEVLE